MLIKCVRHLYLFVIFASCVLLPGSVVYALQTQLEVGRLALICQTPKLGQPLELYIINADGTQLTQLTAIYDYVNNPVWSPDGTEIAFISNLGAVDGSSRREGGNDIYVIQADGSNLRRVAASPSSSEIDLSWSPDGRQLVYSTDMNLVGEGVLARMTLDEVGAEKIVDELRRAEQVDWSPNGEQIAFQINKRTGPRIYTMQADGTRNQPLFPNTTPAQGSPSWSPDGMQIAFVLYAEVTWLATFDLQTGEIRRLTSTGYYINNPDWSPDGTMISFDAFQHRIQQVFVYCLATGSVTQVTNAAQGCFSASWQPAS